MPDIFIHKKALVETKTIGQGSRIWAFVHILPGARIGKNVNICEHCFIENDVKIGDDVTIKTGVSIWDGLIVEDKVFIGPCVVFTNDLYPRSKNKYFKRERILLKEGCSIGANSTVLAGRTIGAYAMVGAGSVVTKDVPDFSLVYGNPAKLRGYVCACGKKLTFKKNAAECACSSKYKLSHSRIESLTKK